MANVAAQLARDRRLALGVGTYQNPIKYEHQDYEELRAQCLASDKKFEDPIFPAVQASLGFKDLDKEEEWIRNLIEAAVWERPEVIQDNPQFINEGAERADIRQGTLNDCWFLSSIASLTLNQERLNRVLPADQSFVENYAGIFHFKFWQYGQWVDVVVDDRLPISDKKLVFSNSTTANEFWCALLEKAYAKLFKSYKALDFGFPVEALEDFTGGVPEIYKTDNPPNNLFQIIRNALTARSPITCFTKKEETVDGTDLVANHAYSITGAEEVPYKGAMVQLIRVRNPWGSQEWNGDWSDRAPQWNEVTQEVRNRLLVNLNNGENWMPFPSFLTNFVRVDICHLNLDDALSNDRDKWSLITFDGKWTAGVNAGGRKDKGRIWTNPQFRITLKNPNEGTAGDRGNPSCTVLVSLMQKDRRKEKEQGGNFKIGFYIYKVPEKFLKDEPLGENFFKENKEVASMDSYPKYREVSKRFALPVGNYVIIPTTLNANEEADFYLRVFSEKIAGAVEISNVVEENLFEPLDAPVGTLPPERYEESDEEKKELNVEDLSRALKKKLSKYTDIKCDGFSRRTCREMINLMDTDNTGTLSADEYKTLCTKLEHYVKIFLEVDANRSGTIDAYEMRNALQKAGFNLSISIQEVIAQRYVSEELSISFEDFIACLIRLETLFKMFQILDSDKNGSITLSLSEWIRAALI